MDMEPPPPCDTIPSAPIPTPSAAPAPADCQNHPHNEQFIVQQYKTRSRTHVPRGHDVDEAFIQCARGLRQARLSSALPIVGWLPRYLRGSPLRRFASDLVCGITVTAVVLPQGMAYGMLAGLPPVYGLYTAMLPPLVYMLFGTCMHLSVGPFALIAMLSAQGVMAVVPEPENDPEGAVAAAGVLALLSGLILLGLGLLRLGFIATFLSDSVLSGYTTAVSIIIPVSQLQHAFQVEVARGTFLQTVRGLFSKIVEGETNGFALGIFLLSVALLLALQTLNGSRRFPTLKRFPVPAELIAVVLSTAACRVFGLGDVDGPGVRVLGEIPKDLPTLRLPEVGRFHLSELVVPSLIVSLMTYITAMSVSKTFARKFGYDVDNNQELVALGFANLVGSVSSSFPAAASLSRTAIIGASGAATPLHNFLTVGILALVLVFCGPLLRTLPLAALAAIVTLAFKSLLLNGIAEARMSWRVSFSDLLMWNIAFWSALLTDVTLGIAIAVAADVLLLLWNSTMPSYEVLGRLAGTERLYRSRRHFLEARPIKGLLIFRFDASLTFANREVFVTKLWQELRAHESEMNGTNCDEPLSFWTNVRLLSGALGGALVGGLCAHQGGEGESDGGGEAAWLKVRAVVVDFSPMSQIDISAVRALEKLRGELRARGTRLIFAHCKYRCYQKLSGMGMFNSFEETRRFDVVCFRELHDAVLFAEGRLPLPPPQSGSEAGSCGSIAMSVLSPGGAPPAPPGSGASPKCAPWSPEPPGGTTSASTARDATYKVKTMSEILFDCGAGVGAEEAGHYEPQ